MNQNLAKWLQQKIRNINMAAISCQFEAVKFGNKNRGAAEEGKIR